MNTNKTANVKSGFKLTFLFILLFLSTGFSQERAGFYGPANAALLPGVIDSDNYSFGKPNESASIYERAALSNHSMNQHYFIENKGQWPSEVLFLARLRGLNAWVTKTGVTYDHFMITQIESRQNFAHMPPHEKEEAERNNYAIKGHVVKFDFIHANENPSAQGDMTSSTEHNYFLGNDPDKWSTGVSLLGRLKLTRLLMAFRWCIILIREICGTITM